MNAIIFVAEIIGFILAVGNNGFVIFIYYTQLSNLVLLIASGLYLLFSLKNKDGDIPKGIVNFRYIATCLTAVTFLTVVFVLIPMMVPSGTQWIYFLLFREANFFHHVLCPILAFVSFLLFEEGYNPSKKLPVIAMLPTLGYAVVTTSLNVAKLLHGPYPFLYVYEQPLWMSVMWFCVIPGGGYLIAILVNSLKKKRMK